MFILGSSLAYLDVGWIKDFFGKKPDLNVQVINGDEDFGRFSSFEYALTVYRLIMEKTSLIFRT